MKKRFTPHLNICSLDDAYREMAADNAREQEALEWVNGVVGDVYTLSSEAIVGGVHS